MSFGKAKAPPGEPSGAFVLATSYSRTTYRRTTIGAAAFHFRVRNGNGWCHCAIITRVRCRTGGLLPSLRKNETAPLSPNKQKKPHLFYLYTKKNYHFTLSF